MSLFFTQTYYALFPLMIYSLITINVLNNSSKHNQEIILNAKPQNITFISTDKIFQDSILIELTLKI